MALGLSDYQLHYARGSDTLTMGPNGATVPNVDIVRISGLLDQEARVGDREFARQDGDIGGLHRASPRFPRLELEVRSNVLNTAYYDLIDTVRSIFRRSRLPSDADGVLTFKMPEEPEQIIRCRPIRRNIPREARTEYGLLPINVELKAADPRIYEVDLSSVGPSSGTFAVTNNGDDWAYPILNFGAVATVQLTNNTNGDVISITSAPGSGNLIADMDRFIRGVNDLVIYRGSTDGYGAWDQPRKPFRLEPGSNSLTLNTGTNVTVQHRDTWL